MTKTFVMIHGSWHGGWAWQAVVRHLEAEGHRACAPTLPGHEPGANRVGLTHQDYVDAVVAYIKEHDLHDLILVGHSFGGSVISRVPEYLPDRIRGLIFLDAFVLADGESVYDNLPGELRHLLDQLAQASGDNTTLLPREVWRDHFIQDAPEEVAQILWRHLSPEPNQPNVEKLDLKSLYSLDIPRSYIYCRQDRALPPGSFHPRMSSRLGTFNLVEMDGSHEVIFTRPAEVAASLIEASSEALAETA
jgi:pimeloyl-ACP methyl ester carboxylesterase